MASALILLPLYIHHLSTETYGALTIYLSFSLLIQIFVTFSFDTSLYIHFHEFKNDFKKLSVFVSSAFIFMVIIGIILALLFTILGDIMFKVALTEKNHFLFSLWSCIGRCRRISSVVQGIQQPLTKS